MRCPNLLRGWWAPGCPMFDPDQMWCCAWLPQHQLYRTSGFAVTARAGFHQRMFSEISKLWFDIMLIYQPNFTRLYEKKGSEKKKCCFKVIHVHMWFSRLSMQHRQPHHNNVETATANCRSLTFTWCYQLSILSVWSTGLGSLSCSVYFYCPHLQTVFSFQPSKRIFFKSIMTA